MRSSIRKRGAIEVQFNWIFVIIAGALILVFFINISTAQRKNADQKLAFDLLSKVDLIMSGALTIPKTGQVFDMPNIEFNVECNMISTLGVNRQFPDRIVFGPSLLDGRNLVVLSQDWNVPYKVSNFLYLTTSEVRYVIVADPSDQNAISFKESLPDNITVEISNLSDIKNKNNYRIRLIILDTVYPNFDNDYFYDSEFELPSFMQEMSEVQLNGIYIETNQNPQNVRFFKKSGDSFEFIGEEISVYKEPMIFGAIFSDDKEQFNCSRNKAFEKLYYVTEVYEKREEMLIDAYEGSSFVECDPSSGGPAGTRDTENLPLIKLKAENRDFSGLSNLESAVASENNNALRQSCAPIY